MSSYNHNIADRFMSLQPALFAFGSGQATFGRLTYQALKPRHESNLSEQT